MNAHQRFVANAVKGLAAAEVAALVASPPGNRSSSLGVAELHEMVTNYADEATRMAWAELLADAAATPRGDGWPATWALPISRMIFELPMPADEHDKVTGIGGSRQAA